MDNELFDGGVLPPELDERVRRELQPGERLLWVGQPDPRRAARASLVVVIFGVCWTAFSVFWIVLAIIFVVVGLAAKGGQMPNLWCCFPAFGVPFVLIGVAMMSPPYWQRRRARMSCYAMTDRRALVLQADFRGTIDYRRYGPEQLGRIIRTEHRDGSGDLIFEEVVTVGRDSDGDPTTHTTRHGFIAVPQVRDVEELLRRVLLDGK